MKVKQILRNIFKALFGKSCSVVYMFLCVLWAFGGGLSFAQDIQFTLMGKHLFLLIILMMIISYLEKKAT